jgi:hypothetical protein
MASDFIGQVNPVVDLESWDDEGVTRADWRNREERNTDLVSIDEAARQLAVDDFGEQRAHGWEIVECEQ